MTQIVVDKTTRERVLESDVIEVVDESGAVLGMFHPFLQPPYDPSLIPPITDEERQRLYAQPGIYSTEQVLERLRSL